MPTLNVFDNNTDTRATVIIFEATRVDDVRIYRKYCPTVATYWGTGGARIPYVFELTDEDEMNEAIGFQPTDGFMGATDDGLSVTIKASDAPAVAITPPIVFEPGALGRLDGPRSSTEVVHTLRAQMGDNHPAIAYSIREDATANNFSATEIETARALQSLQPSVQSHHAQTFVADDTPPAVVRRLTPIECERLQGFPDNWTADQADSHRYKQMGNAVTVNVIAWIGARL